jgi:hypothetical protein
MRRRSSLERVCSDTQSNTGRRQLSQLLITAGPSGFAQQPDSTGDTGPSDLAKAARDDGKPDATSVLKKDGFVAGYQRLWADPKGGTYVVVYALAAEVASAQFARLP